MELLYMIVEFGILAVVVVGFGILLGVTAVVRDFEMVIRRPLVFIVETLIVAFIPAVPMLFFVVSRGISMGTALRWFYGLAIKFGLFHILFQTSGFYTFMFS